MPEERSPNIVVIHDPQHKNANGSPLFAAGNKAGRGRPRGSENKVTRVLKDAIIEAAVMFGDKHGKEQGHSGLTGYLFHLAENQPKSFAALVGRVLPLQNSGTIQSRRLYFAHARRSSSSYASVASTCRQT